MHELYELRDNLCNKLKEYGKKQEISGQSLEIVDKLAHTIKNIDKIIERHEEQYGMSSMDGGSYRNGRGEYRGTYEGSYDGMSTRGRASYERGRGSNARRDSMGRYSSDGYSGSEEMVSDLREMMKDSPDEKTRMEFQKFISKIENM